MFASFANAQNERPTKKSALARLNKCSVELSEYNCSEDNAQYLIQLYYKGDKALLKPLLNASLKSDGALSEVLGTFYADVLERKTESFLLALSEKTNDEQIRLSRKAFEADGSGNPPEWEIRIKEKLNKIVEANNKNISPTAKICVEQLNDFLASKVN